MVQYRGGKLLTYKMKVSKPSLIFPDYLDAAIDPTVRFPDDLF